MPRGHSQIVGCSDTHFTSGSWLQSDTERGTSLRIFQIWMLTMSSCNLKVTANLDLLLITRTQHIVMTRLSTWNWMGSSRGVRTRSTALCGHHRPSTMDNSRRNDRFHLILPRSCKVVQQVGIDRMAAHTYPNTAAARPIHRQENEVEALRFSQSNARSASKCSIACIRLNNIRRRNRTKSGDASRGTAARPTLDAIHCRDINSNTVPEDTHVSCANRTTNVRSSRGGITLPNIYANAIHRALMAVLTNSQGSKRRCRTS